MNDKIKGLLLAIVLAVLGGLVWISRPIWHWFFMWGYVNPAVWEPILLAAIVCLIISGVGAVIAKLVKRRYDREIQEIREKPQKSFTEYDLRRKKEREIRDLREDCKTAMLVFASAVVIGGWIVIGPLQVTYPQCHLAQTLEVSEIAELPDIEPSTVRIMPMAVSQRYAKDALQYPRHKLGTGDIAFVNGTPNWIYGIIPNGPINFFVIKDKGAAYVDMTTSVKNVKITEKDMEIGEGMGIRDWYKWRLYKEKYWIDCEEPYFIPTSEGELYLAVPLVRYEYHWRFPAFYTVPRWAGTALIHSDGDIEFLTPEQALAHPVLKDQKLFPEKLSRYYINSFRYTHGIKNRLFFHEEQLEISEVAEQENIQPFLVVTKDGPKWFIACEPWGEAYGIFRIYLTDARTGKIQLYERPKVEALTGPVKAIDYVRKQNPIIDWTRMAPVEPIPLIREGRLYWQIKIIPEDAAGIAYTAMVDALTVEVIELKRDEEIRQFIEGVLEIPTTPIVNVTAIVIIQEDGREIQRIPLYENQTVLVIP